jgi:hypothetical protein
MRNGRLATCSALFFSVASYLYAPSHKEVKLFECAGEHLKEGHIHDAVACYTELLTINPHNIAALYNKGYTYKTAGYLDTAIEIYHEVLSMDPSYDNAHLALGFAYLNKGDFVRGWKQHERYLKKSNKNADALRVLLANGTVAGKRILCVHEGGIGDTLMCIRFVAELKKYGAHTICAVQETVVPLLAHCPYIDELYPYTPQRPPHDAFSTLLSLPAIFTITEETIPRDIPYLFPKPELVEQWCTKLSNTHGLKIGLCWQSDVHNDVSRLPIARRGMPLALWFPLLATPNVHVYSLQRFDGTEQIATIPSGCTLHVDDALDTVNGSFMDSAALISQVDLVITIDSAVAHLAGALGKSVLLLLPYAVDWRWIYGRTDSPWYPSMTIFKQPKPFDWESAVQDVYNYLQNHYGVVIEHKE